MKGRHRIVIQNKKVKYDFEIKRNITVIRGDSATGKTTLIDMIREFYENGPDSGIECRCDKICTVLEGKNWNVILPTIHDSIVFIDEGNHFVVSKEFAKVIKETDNYYVIVTREGLEALPYSVEEIYGIRNSRKYGSLKQTYNELYSIYGAKETGQDVKPEIIITEDSNSGFQFFQEVCNKSGLECRSANGKSNIFSALVGQNEKKLLVIADGAAFGSEMGKVMQLVDKRKNIFVYLPESFEWLVLKSGVLHEPEVEKILSDPSLYIESKEFFSWERFFTDLLIGKTADSYLKYSKKTLNMAYVQNNIVEKVLEKMENITLIKPQ